MFHYSVEETQDDLKTPFAALNADASRWKLVAAFEEESSPSNACKCAVTRRDGNGDRKGPRPVVRVRRHEDRRVEINNREVVVPHVEWISQRLRYRDE